MVSSATSTFYVTDTTDLRDAIEVKHHLVQHLVELFGQLAWPDHEQILPFLAIRHQLVGVLEGIDDPLQLGAQRRVLDHGRVLKLRQEGADDACSLIDLKALAPVQVNHLRCLLDPVRNTDDLVNYVVGGLLIVHVTIRGSWWLHMINLLHNEMHHH